jgi:hypothetical protein
MKVEKLVVEERAISRTETQIVVSTGILCCNCGTRIEPVVMNGQMAKSWTHLGKPFRNGGGVFCDGDGDERAEPLVELS